MKYKHIDTIKNIGFSNSFHQRSQIGLDNAYESESKVFIKDDTMFIAGTSNLQDVFDDLKIPLGLTKHSQRYKDASKLLTENPNVKKLVGHSMGGMASLEMQKQNPTRNLDVTTYGAPVVQIGGQKHNRFRHQGDPISMLDSGAVNVPKSGFNPLELHSYYGYG
jgi:hypothetical protein